MANGTELETNKNICVGFFVTQISQMTQIFIHRITRNLFGGFLLRRLLTDFRGGDLFGRCRYPPGIGQRDSIKKSVEICEICGTKKLPRKKSASSAKSA